jgi:ParB family chromosome partitioning protein
VEVKEIPIELVRGTAFNFRDELDEVSQELLDSVKEHGIKQPILLRKRDAHYQIVAGTRRYAAVKKLGLPSIPAIIEDLDDKAAYELALTENLQRKTLSPFEEAKAFLDYVNEYKWGSITDLSRKVSKSHSYIINRLKLVELPASISKKIVTGEQFSVGHAEELLRLGSNEKMEEMADAIKEHGLTRDSTAEVVNLVKEHKMPINKAVETVRFTEKLKNRAQQISDQAKRSMVEANPEKAKRIADIADEGFKNLEKRLGLFPERSQKMEPKFEQLATWEERGVIPYTIWDFQYRDDYAGDKDFHGNCSPQVVEQCIWRFTTEGETVCDPMAGSGTVIDVCKRHKRNYIAYDINPTRPDIAKSDARHIPLGPTTVDMIFIHPPYWNLVAYTNGNENKSSDLSRASSLDAYLRLLREVFDECKRVLRQNKYMCVLLGDIIREGKFIPICRKATEIAESLGFRDCGYAIKLAHGEVSRKKSGVIVAELAYTNNLKISHDLVMFFKKEV